ncbi:MAG: MmgE/PrpD family protein [Halofilum sp. (in: g-proteobacteria)]|nr:MmgE/PrpD family protein [Halofilum sp. (in: g-proteobacteria)]
MSASPPPAAGPDPRDAAAWVAGLRLDDIPAEVAERARELLLDTLGVAIGAGRTDAAAIAYGLAAAQFGAGDTRARLAFDGRAVSPAGAAWALATRIDNLDGHDGYQPGKGHAGVAVVPALLATAEADARASGADALAALVAGYEIACRAAVALHGSAGDYHSSGAWNALGAAAAAGACAAWTPTCSPPRWGSRSTTRRARR